MKTVSVHTASQPESGIIVRGKIGFSCTQREKGVFPAAFKTQKKKKKKKKSRIVQDTQEKK